MKNAGLGNKVICQLFDPIPRDPGLLAASLERPPPKIGDAVPEPDECSTVCRHCVIFKEAGYDLPQPSPLFGDWLVLRRRISSLISLSFARMRSPRDFRFNAKRP